MIKENTQKFCDKLRDVLINEQSINSDNTLWNYENFNNLKRVLNENEKSGNSSFAVKIAEQLKEAKSTIPNLTDEQLAALYPLTIELMSLYYVFPENITARTKKNALKELIEFNNKLNSESQLKTEHFSTSFEAINEEGIGSGGMGYNTNKQKEFFYLVDVFAKWFSLTVTERKANLSDSSSHLKIQNVLDDVADSRSPQTRHVLLYLLFPDYYEPIISSSQKWKIVRVFSDFINQEKLVNKLGLDVVQSTDQKIAVISESLEKLRGKPTNFYDEELLIFWDETSTAAIKDLDTELLEYKKQVVLYGPPGTSKTYTAKMLSLEIIRHRMANDFGVDILKEQGQKRLQKALAENVHRLQLHPAYSYEDFIRGLQFENGNTVFKAGFLMLLLEKMKSEPELPHVLILDEINRVDLSRLFGECFSALENRGEAVDLLGANEHGGLKLLIPDNLYIIGTMNLIDHSIEQIDFALRRRFLWVEATYNSEALYSICEQRWRKLDSLNKRFSWHEVEEDFTRLVSAADNLNKSIQHNEELGADFVLGHVFFIDAVAFLHSFLQPYSQRRKSYLFRSGGQWNPPIERLWNLSLSPLLNEYLSGLERKAKGQIMKKLKDSFKP